MICVTTPSFAGKHGQHIDANQELLALGSANLAAGVSTSFPVGASGSRTAVNDQMGGRTQAVGLIAAVVIAIVLLFFTAPAAWPPFPRHGGHRDRPDRRFRTASGIPEAQAVAATFTARMCTSYLPAHLGLVHPPEAAQERVRLTSPVLRDDPAHPAAG